MCTERKNQILLSLEKKMPSSYTYRNNFELEAALNKVVEGMCEIIFEKTHSDCRSIKDLKDIIWQITYESKDVDKRLLNLLEDDMNDLETYLKIIKSGNLGEERAYKELVHLSEDDHTTIIQNITLEKEQEERAEYDDLVISPNGVFIIEVKNIKCPATIDRHGNLTWGEKGFQNYSRDSRRRKYILKKVLREALEKKELYDVDFSVEEILLWTNDHSSLDNQKQQSIISKSIEEVCDYIDYYPCRKRMTPEEMKSIREILDEVSLTDEYQIKDVNIKAIYDRFSYVIAAYENERVSTINDEIYSDLEVEPEVVVVETDENMFENIVFGALAAIGGATIGYLSGKAISRFFR